MDDYLPVYQLWTLVRDATVALPTPALATEVQATPREEQWRLQMQTMRVSRGMSVGDLASRVQCDVYTLAAFERGDEVLGPEMRRKISLVLGL